MHEYADKDNPTKAVMLEETDAYFRVGGYGVVFGGEDLEGETFSKDTDFWLDRLTRTPPVLYQHGKDAKAQKSVIGAATVEDPDDIGLWVEAQIDLANKYAAAIRELAGKGLLGWSSGTAGHLAEREGTLIKSWPIVEMSLTPTPAEPRTLGVSEIRSLTDWADGLKELLPEDAGDASAVTEQAADTTETITEPIAQIEIKETEMTEEIKNQGPDIGQLVQEALTKAIRELPGYDKLLNAAPEGKDHSEEKSFGDYLVALQRGDRKRIETVYKAALSEESGATGGYLVPAEYSNDILRMAASASVVRSNGATIIPMGSREWNVPALNYTDSTAGRPHQLGGIVATWTEEAGAKTETEPSFENIKLTYHELSGYTLASNMVRQDAGPALEALLRQLFAEAIRWYEDWAFLQGTGAGQPLGVFKSDVLLTEVAATSSFILSDIAGMLKLFHSRMPNGGVWVMHPTVIEKLILLADGSNASNNLIWSPNTTEPQPQRLFGRPIVFSDVMPVLPAGSSATQKGGVLLADFSYYLIGDRGGLQIDFSEHYKFINNQGTWRFTKYVDGQPWMSQAMYLADGSNQVSPFVSLSGA